MLPSGRFELNITFHQNEMIMAWDRNDTRIALAIHAEDDFDKWDIYGGCDGEEFQFAVNSKVAALAAVHYLCYRSGHLPMKVKEADYVIHFVEMNRIEMEE